MNTLAIDEQYREVGLQEGGSYTQLMQGVPSVEAAEELARELLEPLGSHAGGGGSR